MIRHAIRNLLVNAISIELFVFELSDAHLASGLRQIRGIAIVDAIFELTPVYAPIWLFNFGHTVKFAQFVLPTYVLAIFPKFLADSIGVIIVVHVAFISVIFVLDFFKYKAIIDCFDLSLKQPFGLLSICNFQFHIII